MNINFSWKKVLISVSAAALTGQLAGVPVNVSYTSPAGQTTQGGVSTTALTTNGASTSLTSKGKRAMKTLLKETSVSTKEDRQEFDNRRKLILDDGTVDTGKISSVGQIAGENISIADANQLAGCNLFETQLLWESAPAQFNKRLNCKLTGSGKGKNEVWIAKLDRQKKFFGVETIQVVLNVKGGLVRRIKFDFLNATSKDGKKNLSRQLQDIDRKLQQIFRDKLGLTTRVVLADGNRYPAWRCREAQIVLEYVSKSHISLVLQPVSGNPGPDNTNLAVKQSAKNAKKNLRENIHKDTNGDVYIDGIPMIVTNTPAGYLERLMRYCGANNVDAQQLAASVKGSKNRGISMGRLLTSCNKHFRANDLIYARKGRFTKSKIYTCIDDGQPILWKHYNSTDFKQRVEFSIKSRPKNGADLKDWGHTVHKQRELHTGYSGARLGIILGYNRKTDEIAVTYNLGPQYSMVWIKYNDASHMTTQDEPLVVILPK